jgi:hypothetical protein
MKGRIVAELAAQLLAIHGDVMHLALIHITHELGEGNFCVLLPVAALLNHGPQHKGRHSNPHPKEYGFYC